MPAEKLTYQDKRKYMNFAIISACYGTVIQRVLSESSVFIIYASALGAGKFLTLITTALIPCMILVFLVPFAYIMEKSGIKKILLPAYSIGFAGLMVAVLAGFFTEKALSSQLFSFGVLLYAISIGIHSAGWFPLQRYIVPAEERGTYFGRMRYSWQIAVAAFLLGASLLTWKDTSIQRLQLIVFIGTLLSLGRIFYIARIPERPLASHVPAFKARFLAAIRDKQLMRYSMYGFLLNLLICSTVPLGFGFVKYELEVSEHLVILISVFSNVFAVAGYYIGSKIIDGNHAGRLFFLVQILFVAVNMFFLLFVTHSTFALIGSAFLICVSAALFAFSSVIATAKMFGMVKENNINVSLAVCFGLYNGGKGLSRVLSSFLVSVLPDHLRYFGIEWSSFQAVFFGNGLLLVIVTSILIYKKYFISDMWDISHS